MTDPPRADHPVVACHDGLDTTHTVPLGALLAATVAEPLVVAGAYHYEPGALGARGGSSPENERRLAETEAGVRRAAQAAGGSTVVRERVLPAQEVAVTLVDLAREEHACALVLGRDRDGSTLRSVLAHAPCPVVVGPSEPPNPGAAALRTVGVAYDGSATAELALTAAISLAETTGARVRLVAVGLTVEDAAVDATAAARPDGPAVEVLLCSGQPGTELVEASRSLDLLLCGSRGRGQLLAAVLGSVSGELVRAACCPVLVVGPGVRPRPSTPFGLTTASR